MNLQETFWLENKILNMFDSKIRKKRFCLIVDVSKICRDFFKCNRGKSVLFQNKRSKEEFPCIIIHARLLSFLREKNNACRQEFHSGSRQQKQSKLQNKTRILAPK